MAKLTFFNSGQNLDITLLGGAINVTLGDKHFQVSHDDSVLLANVLAIQLLKQKVVNEQPTTTNISEIIELLKSNK